MAVAGTEVAHHVPAVAVTVSVEACPALHRAVFEVVDGRRLRIRRSRVVITFRKDPSEDDIFSSPISRSALEAFKVVARCIDPVETDGFAQASGVHLLNRSGVGFAFHQVLHIVLEERVGSRAFEFAVKLHHIIFKRSAGFAGSNQSTARARTRLVSEFGDFTLGTLCDVSAEDPGIAGNTGAGEIHP